MSAEAIALLILAANRGIEMGLQILETLEREATPEQLAAVREAHFAAQKRVEEIDARLAAKGA